MEMIKNIFYWNLKFIPFSVLKNIQKHKLILPLYHVVSDDRVPHVEHLYSFRNVKQFEKDLDFFLKHYNPITLQDLVNCVQKDNELDKKSVLITFDDGYKEVYHTVAPILLKKSIPSVFFINSDFVDNKNMFYRNKTSLLIDFINSNTKSIPVDNIQTVLKNHEIFNDNIRSAILSIPYHQKNILDDIALILNIDFNAYLKEKEPYLSSIQITKLIENGFNIGSHSIDHPLYKHLTLSEQLRQTKESFNFLKEKFNLPYRAFAFPHNDKGINDFFNETHFNGVIDISFGTSGLNAGYCKNNFQRQSMENTQDSAKKIYKNHYKYNTVLQLKNSDFLSKKLTKKRKKVDPDSTEKNKSKVKFEEIRIEKIKVKDLLEFTRKYNKNRKPEDLAPVSEQRAHAHSQNPYADENDIGLILAYKGDICVGYLGIVPGFANIRGINEKIYFPSTWLVSRIVRGQSVGSLLMKEALTLNKALIGTGFNRNSEKTMVALGFEYIRSLHYTQINFEKLNHRFMQLIDKSLSKLDNPLIHLNKEKHRLYNYFKKVIYRRISNKLEKNLANIIYKEVNFINYEHNEPKESENYKFYRDTKAVNWMLIYPWVKGKGKSGKEGGTEYFFSEVREEFYNVALEIYSAENKKILGYLVLSISKDKDIYTLKLLDHELLIENSNTILLAIVMKYASDVNADKVDITSNVAQLLYDNGLLKPNLLRKLERRYLFNMSDMSNKVAIAMKNINPQYCDGDMPFY